VPERTLEVRVWRGREDGRFQAFAVPRRASQTVLDVVTWIQRHLDTTLSYRYACRVGMCGSCAMTVNGRPRWTCRTHVDKVAEGDTLTVAPLANLPVVKDLAADMAPFFDKWAKAGGRFVPAAEPPADFAIVPPATRERRAADAGIECIGCGVCYAACDIVRWNRDYLGPAALNRAWTLVNDVRDTGGEARLAAVAGDAGCHACHSHESCRTHCPKQINPTASIAGLKRATTLAVLKGRL
jgi:fumarate reductase iron-sulfur subunit